MTEEKKICFVISPIGSNGSDIRKRADQILKHVLKPALEECGFTAIRADGISEPGLITSQVIQHIVEDSLVIADLTGMNPNVFYELAIRHAIRKPLVQIIQKNETIPFDVAGMRTVSVDHTDLDSVEDAKKEIVEQINCIIEKIPGEIESPISVALELQSLRHSDKPEERSYAEILSVLTDLRSEIRSGFTDINKLISPDHEVILQPDFLLLVQDLRKENKAFMNQIKNHISRLKALNEVGFESITEYQQQVNLELTNLELFIKQIQRLEIGLG